ncbi:MAG: hypothetical protein RL196_842 [Actinomycetota bacterium]|jgi:hypothetical protein
MASANPHLSALFGRVLRLTSLTTLVIAVIGGTIGAIFYGSDGVFSAAIGAGMALVFGALTVLSVWLGGRYSLGVFFGAVMGGWLLKLVIFLVLTVALKNADFLVRPLFFFTVVAAILASLVVDAIVATKARIPAVGE